MNLQFPILLSALITLMLIRSQAIHAQNRQSTHTYSLPELVNLALKNDPRLTHLREREIQDHAEVEKARAAMKPNVNLALGHLYQSDPDVLNERINRELRSIHTETLGDFSGSNKTNTKVRFSDNSYIIGLGFRQFVYASGLFSTRVDFEDQKRRQTRLQYTLSEQLVTTSITQLYYNAYFGARQIEILATVQKLRKRASAAMKRRVSIMQATQLQGDEAHNQFLTAELDATRSRFKLDEALDAMHLITGLTILDPNQLKQPCNGVIERFNLQKIDYYLRNIEHESLAIKRMAAAVKLAETGRMLIEKQDNFAPKALMFGSMEYVKDDNPETDAYNWSLGLAVIMPLYDGDYSSQNRRKAASTVRDARLQLAAFRRRLLTKIRGVYRDLILIEKERNILKNTYHNAIKRRLAAEASRQNKMITGDQLIAIKIIEKTAHLSFVSQIAERVTTFFKLHQLSGLSVKELISCEG